MKKYEFESLLKSFALFFISLGLFLALIFYLEYRQKIADLDQKLFTQMRLCSFDLQCPDFKIDFSPKGEKQPLFLYHEKDGLSAYFTLPGSKNYYMKISYPPKSYDHDAKEIYYRMVVRFLALLLIIAILSLLFSLYALHPMKKALVTIEEFIRDVLHDFNTPIFSIFLNSELLKRDAANGEKVERIQQSAQNILMLQENLRAYLRELKSQKESFDAAALINEILPDIQKLYPDITTVLHAKSIPLFTHKGAFKRVLVNLLTNAAKYNKPNGRIDIRFDSQKEKLLIEDTGIGIKNPDKAFERFYTENARGTGIGLHIVKKLCEEMQTPITVESIPAEGSRFILDLKAVTKW